MAKEGSMRDNVARRSAGHASAIAMNQEEEGAQAKPASGSQRKQSGQRQLTQAQKSVLERDKQVMKGGPEDGSTLEEEGEQQEEEEKTPRQKGKKKKSEDSEGTFAFSYRGKKFSSEEELEDYLDELEIDKRAHQRSDNKTPPVEKKEKKFEADFDQLVKEPEKVFGAFADFLIDKIKGELVPAYQADTAINNFWTSFYQENGEWAGKPKLNRIIQGVFMDNQDTLGPLPLDRARARLARLVRAEFKDLGINVGGSGYVAEEEGEKKETKHRTAVEGGSTGSVKRKQEAEEEEESAPVTLTQIMKSRKNFRLQARNGFDVNAGK